jgi:hypothetical protein
MSRPLPTTVSAAITADATRPVYLIEFGFDTTQRAATWDADITWNGQTWSASGVQVTRLTSKDCSVKLPAGADDGWLALVMSDGVRGRTINIYEHHYDSASSPQTDAVLVFSGIMDDAQIGSEISLRVLESSRAKTFPPTSMDEPTFTHLLTPGTTIKWGTDTIKVN